jgi:hypothetical protein
MATPRLMRDTSEKPDPVTEARIEEERRETAMRS